jgi:hypothetical protein
MGIYSTYDDDTETFPHETILTKLEVTDMGAFDNKKQYDDFARGVILDRKPEKVLFESDKTVKKQSSEVLHMRYGGRGDRYSKTPNHSDMMLADTTPDERGSSSDPLMFKMRNHTKIRGEQKAKIMPVQSEQDAEASIDPQEAMRMHQQINKRSYNAIKFFSKQHAADVRATKIVPEDPLQNFKYIMDQDIESDLVEPKPNDYYTLKTWGNKAPIMKIRYKTETGHLPGNDYLSMNRSQKRELSKQIVNASKRVEIQELQDGLLSTNTCKANTPTDVAKIYRNIKNDQLMQDQLQSNTTGKSAELADASKAVAKTSTSEGFIESPQGFYMTGNNAPTGHGGVYRDPQQDQVTIDMTNSDPTRSMGGLPSNKSIVGTSVNDHPSVYINNALMIAKSMKLPDNRKRRVQMANTENAGIIVGFHDTSNQAVKLAKSMIPVINNHTVMNKTEYFINKPQETVNTVSHNSALPSDRKNFQSNVQLQPNGSYEETNKTTRMHDIPKGQTETFGANDASIMFSMDNQGLRKGGARLGSRKVRITDAKDDFQSEF